MGLAKMEIEETANRCLQLLAVRGYGVWAPEGGGAKWDEISSVWRMHIRKKSGSGRTLDVAAAELVYTTSKGCLVLNLHQRDGGKTRNRTPLHERASLSSRVCARRSDKEWVAEKTRATRTEKVAAGVFVFLTLVVTLGMVVHFHGYRSPAGRIWNRL